MTKQGAGPIGDLRKEQAKAAVRGGLAFLLTIACLVSAALWLPAAMRFPTGPIEGFSFASRVNLVPGIALLIAIRVVARIRFYSVEDNRGSAFAPPSQKLAVSSAFLQNTLEQTVLAVIANFALASVGTPSALAYMSAGAALFLVGRVTFYLGYPYGAGARAFGMVMTMTPALAALGWAVVDLVL